MGLLKEPVVGYNFNDIFSKPDNLRVKSGRDVVSPYSGKVIELSNGISCPDGVKIEHNINNKKYYSNFCRIKNIEVKEGDRVIGGEKIGVSSSNINFKITDKYGDNVTKEFYSTSRETKKEKKGNFFNSQPDLTKDNVVNSLKKSFNITDDNVDSKSIASDLKQSVGADGTDMTGQQFSQNIKQSLGANKNNITSKQFAQNIKNSLSENSSKLDEELKRIKNLLK